MSTGSDYYYTGGERSDSAPYNRGIEGARESGCFSDWSGGSTGNFGSSSSPGGSSSSSSGGSSGGSNQGYEPGDWKYGCGCLVIIIAVIATLIWFACGKPNGWFSSDNEACAVDSDSIAVEDTSYYEPSIPDTNECYQQVEPVKHKHVPLRGSSSSSDDDEYDEDEKEAHEYDGLDDGEGDW